MPHLLLHIGAQQTHALRLLLTPFLPACRLQNAGKSSLINAMRQVARLPKERDVTTAPLPGTTLGERPPREGLVSQTPVPV